MAAVKVQKGYDETMPVCKETLLAGIEALNATGAGLARSSKNLVDVFSVPFEPETGDNQAPSYKYEVVCDDSRLCIRYVNTKFQALMLDASKTAKLTKASLDRLIDFIALFSNTGEIMERTYEEFKPHSATRKHARALEEAAERGREAYIPEHWRRSGL